MRNKASVLLKQIITGLTTMAKAKTMAIKRKTKAIKTRLIIFSLLQNRKLLVSSFSDKLDALLGHKHNGGICKEMEDDVSGVQQSQSIVVYNSGNAVCVPSTPQTKHEDGDDCSGEGKCPELSESVFDKEEMELAADPGVGGSVIEMVKNSKEYRGEEFRLEDEIDRVADLFIKRFHCQMRMQKQLSLKRRQEMLGSSP